MNRWRGMYKQGDDGRKKDVLERGYIIVDRQGGVSDAGLYVCKESRMPTDMSKTTG